MDKKVKALKKFTKNQVYAVSAVSGDGVNKTLNAAWQFLGRDKKAEEIKLEKTAAASDKKWTPV